jgi:hypothetical protein
MDTTFVQGLESLIERDNQGDLEKELLHSFPEEERQKFGLPPIYRGLPKLYLKDNPRFFRIRENFNDLPLLRRLYLDNALLKLYSKVELSKNDEVVIFTWMMNDGLGDSIAQLEAARILHTQFPHLKIRLILLAPENKILPDSPRHILRYKNNECVSLPPKLTSSASLILQLPTFYPHTQALFHSKPLELLGECGLIDRGWFHPKTGHRCLGLHFLEKGVFIKSVKPSPLQDDRLSELLSKPGRFNLNYTKSRRGNLLYFHTLLKSLVKNREPITVAFSNRDAVFDLLQNPILRRCKIAKVRLYDRQFVTEIPIQQKGKELTLIHIETISQQDFHSLIVKSDDLVGCTGDNSLLETIAAQKPFFYDPPYHKRPFLKDLIEIAKRISPAFVEFLQLSMTPADPKLEDDLAGWLSEDQFEKTSDEEVGEKLASLMQSTDLRAGTARLSQILARQYNANDILCHLVQRAVFLKKHPDFRRKEEKVLHGFLHGSETLSSALKKVSSALEKNPQF